MFTTESGDSLMHTICGEFAEPIFSEREKIALMQNAVERGADINQKNERAETPLFIARHEPSSLEFINCILDAGADVSLKFEGNRTFIFALLQSVRSEYYFILESDKMQSKIQGNCISQSFVN